MADKKTLRDEMAMAIMTGICAGDWQLPIGEKSWDVLASRRAYEIADAMLKEREITTYD